MGGASERAAWVVRSGRPGKETVDFNLLESVVTLGWGDWVASADMAMHGAKVDLDADFAERFPRESINTRESARSAILGFRDKIKVGDIVVMPLKGSHTAKGWIAIGGVAGAMEWNPLWSEGTRLRRNVDWLTPELDKLTVEFSLRESIDSPGSVFQVRARSAVDRLLHLAEHGSDPGPEGIHALSLSGDEADVVSGVTKEIPEGAKKRVSVNRYERDPEARRRCVNHHGTACQVCGMTFEGRYGAIGRGFIHVHHLVPLAQIDDHGSHNIDPVNDLVPVCPNCHAMLHRVGGPPLSVTELMDMMNRASDQAGTA